MTNLRQAVAQLEERRTRGDSPDDLIPTAWRLDPELSRLWQQVLDVLNTSDAPQAVRYRERFPSPPSTEAEMSEFYDLIAKCEEVRTLLLQVVERQAQIRVELSSDPEFAKYVRYRAATPGGVSRELWDLLR